MFEIVKEKLKMQENSCYTSYSFFDALNQNGT